MRILNFDLKFNLALNLALCMSLFVSVAKAENISVPDKEHRQGMSYEEYSHYRENMREHMGKHMERMTPEERKQAQGTSARPPERIGKHNHDSAYGQGYHSREKAEGKPDLNSDSKPEHPRSERFNQGQMRRR